MNPSTRSTPNPSACSVPPPFQQASLCARPISHPSRPGCCAEASSTPTHTVGVCQQLRRSIHSRSHCWSLPAIAQKPPPLSLTLLESASSCAEARSHCWSQPADAQKLPPHPLTRLEHLLACPALARCLILALSIKSTLKKRHNIASIMRNSAKEKVVRFSSRCHRAPRPHPERPFFQGIRSSPSSPRLSASPSSAGSVRFRFLHSSCTDRPSAGRKPRSGLSPVRLASCAQDHSSEGPASAHVFLSFLTKPPDFSATSSA